MQHLVADRSASARVERRFVHETDRIAAGIDQRERALAPVPRLHAIVDLLAPGLPSALVHGVDVGNGEEDLLGVRSDLTTPRSRIDAREDRATTVKIMTVWRHPLAREAEDSTKE